jgi:hypothetical protein
MGSSFRGGQAADLRRQQQVKRPTSRNRNG